MIRISGFRLRGKRTTRSRSAITLPEPRFDKGAQDRAMAKIKAMGESFYAMSEDEYGDWLDVLPQDEFFELMAAMIELGETPGSKAA
jgi:hypothetical protein